MSSESSAIVAHGLGKTFDMYAQPVDRLKQLLWGKHKQYAKSYVALDDISFSLPKGQVLGLIGRNGAGKSTLLQLICGTLQPTVGDLMVNGRIAALLELGAGFNPEFSGRENVFLNGSVLGLSPQEIEARFEAIAEFAGIGDFMEQPVKTYSSGMYVRLAFAVATSINPDILVIDEALSVGDGAFARKSFERIMNLKAQGATILFCSHSMYHIEAICDTALWLDKGKLRLAGPPSEVVARYQSFLNEQETAPAPMPADKPSTPAQGLAVAGSGSARLLRILPKAHNRDGNRLPDTPLKLSAGNASLELQIEFVADPALPVPSLAFGIDREDGLSLTSGGSMMDRFQIPRSADGRYSVQLRFPALALMKGRYRLSIFLACEHALHVYDQAPNCVEFEVTHTGAAQGFVFLPHAWNDGPLHIVP